MRHNFAHHLTETLITAALVVAVLAVGAAQTRAQQTAPATNRLFGAATMAFGQTTRINIVQVGDPNLFPPGAVCDIIINYLAADGLALVSPFRMVVQPGQIVFADVDRNSLAIRGNRLPFRVAVSLIGDPNALPNPCAEIRATVEVYDNLTGRTMVFIGDPNQ
jgi:hypothetical protein